MRKRVWKILCSLLCVLLVGSLGTMRAQAGKREKNSPAWSDAGGLNGSEWNSTDTNIMIQDGKLVIPADTSTKYTKVISRLVAAKEEGTGEFVTLHSNGKLTELPEGGQFSFAFGLGSIEADSGDKGSVELIFTNENGILLSVVAYGEGGAVTILDKTACGVSQNTQFKLDAGINVNGILRVDIDGRSILSKEIPVSGSGRVGVLQTGACGAEFTELTAEYNYYDRPENVNIKEDFETGEWNANLLVARSWGGDGVWNAGQRIEDYNGSKVLMFWNTSNSYFGTKLMYSNFEMTFDVPFFQLKEVQDEEGFLKTKGSQTICFGFGEEKESPRGHYDYITDTDFFLLSPTYAESHMKKLWTSKVTDKVNLLPADGGDVASFSVRLTVVDGKATLQVKPLSGTNWTTLAENDYSDSFRSGYIKIWTTSNGVFAIDNFTVTNLDESPNLVEAGYESSVMTVKDYERTEEESKLVFREEEKGAEAEQKPETRNQEMLIIGVCAAGAVLLVAAGIIVCIVRNRKPRTERGTKDEK